MNFFEKIDKILKTNTLGISSPSALEDYIEAGRGSITTPYRNKDAPGLKTQKKIIEKLRISPEWWETGKGEIYLSNVETTTIQHQPDDPQETFRRVIEGFILNAQMHKDEVADLRKDKNDFKNELLEMVRALRGAKSPPHKTK